MDLFTEKANNYLKLVKSPPAKDKKEEDAESAVSTADAKQMGLTKDVEAAVNIASKLATRPGRANLPMIGAQSKMNAAYGNLMKSIAGKITKLSNNIR